MQVRAYQRQLFTIAEVAKELGVRSCLCYEVSDRDGMEKAKEAVMENAAFIKYALQDDSDMLAGMMGMHAQFTISDATMELQLPISQKRQAIISMWPKESKTFMTA